MRNKLFGAVLAVIFLLPLVMSVSAEEENVSPELTAECVVSMSNGEWCANLTDGAETTFVTVPAGESITVEGAGIGALYVKFHLKAHPWTVSFGDISTDCGNSGFLHEYVPLSSISDSVTMTFSEDAQICELRIFGEGEPPADVQVWKSPYEKADVMLLSSHSDDEQLFFAGLIPHCAANDIDLQVVYFCYHDDVPVRLHEQLNGLWAAGATHYPVIGRFPDLYSESLDWAVNSFADYGYEREDFVAYQCEMIRRFKPEIIVAHDVNGEYGHGTHRLNTNTLIEALELSADAASYPESASAYGVWNVPKTYVHLWEDKQITMNYDEPLEYFGGRTAYQMSVEGYGCHNSQHWTWFTDWLVGTEDAPITSASQITKYSPCKFGLYRTTVGDDMAGDMFENVTLRRDIPPETEPPETSAPDTETTTLKAVTETMNDDTDSPSDDKNNSGADTVFFVIVIVVVLCGGITALVLIKKS
ncbi:MAG: hypothetical protein E7578_05390 [Ruminococcaceae bacterium]|nr:hypothetical protein [Oscillospiraceae bacterium]